jgi:hypothetical protein
VFSFALFSFIERKQCFFSSFFFMVLAGKTWVLPSANRKIKYTHNNFGDKIMSYNNTIAIPASYFKKHTDHEYQDWYTALIREFVQNGRDCGSSRIDVTIKDGIFEVSNNGESMSLETMTNILLSLGGSKKDDGSVGGFGQAKNLLYFRWDNWEITSGSYSIAGSGPTYGDPQENEQVLQGTKSTLLIERNQDEYYLESRSRDYLERCFLGSCHTYLNDERITGQIHRGRVIKDLYLDGEENQHDKSPFARIFYNKNREDTRVRVFVGGLYMFGTGYTDDLKGSISIELLKPSTKLLTANRDGLKYQYKCALDSFIRELTKDQKKMTRKKSEETWLFQGDGTVKVGYDDQDPEMKSDGESNDSLFDVVKGFMQDMETFNKAIEESHTLAKTSRKAFDSASISQEQTLGPKLIEHDYFIIKEAECSLTRSRIKSILQSQRAKVLFVQWTNILKVVLDAIDFQGSFTPGLIFGDELEAGFKTLQGRTVFLLNPQAIKKAQSARCQLDQMMQLAVHEICHINNKWHDEDFVNNYHHVWSKAMKRYSDLQQYSYSKVSKSLKS